MKKILIICVSLLFVQTAMAQNLFVQQTSGTDTGYKLSQIDKITFSAGKMLVAMQTGENGSFAISDICKLYFGENPERIDNAAASRLVVWNPAAKTLTVNGQAGNVVSVYSAGGVRVLQVVQTIAHTPIDLTALPAGTYVVEAEGKTIKIVR